MAYQGETLKSTSINGVKVYTISSQNRSAATWLPPKKQRALRKNINYQQRMELIQDLRFETATTKIKATPDGEFVIASGIYPPQIKVYELRQLSLKFERHFDSEIIDFQILADDYSKLAFLCSDRSICLHAKYGKHYTLRIPRMGRDIEYDCWSCDLLCAASSPELYRINLEQGRFMSSLTSQSSALNVVCRSKLHGLVACGGEDGVVECFDMRMRCSVGRINAVRTADDIDEEVTALEFDGEGGFLMGVGSSGGKVLLYDLRSSHPLRVKDHMYGSAILDIKWQRTLNSERPKLITTDSHVVRIWDPETGDGMTSIEPATDNKINDICVFKDSGLMLLALDNSQIPSFFVPALGPTPKWCSSLENLTEEMEDAQAIIYDNFKFLTKEDLEKLNLTNLVGTNLLTAVMHGFFIDNRLYKKALELANPFDYENYLEQWKKEKLEAERASRITIKRKLPKVNRILAARILEDEEKENEKKEGDDLETKKKSKKKKGLSSEDLKDERFTAMFKNKDFQIDEKSQEYISLHPVPAKTQPSLVDEHFEPMEEDEDQSPSDSDADALSSEEELENDKRVVKKKPWGPRLYEVKDERHAEAFWNTESLANEDSLPLGERVARLQGDQGVSGISNNVKFGPGGSREISFATKSSAKYREDEEDKEPYHGKRGVQSLGLKPDRGHGGGRGRGRGGGQSRGGGRGRGRRGRH